MLKDLKTLEKHKNDNILKIHQNIATKLFQSGFQSPYFNDKHSKLFIFKLKKEYIVSKKDFLKDNLFDKPTLNKFNFLFPTVATIKYISNEFIIIEDGFLIPLQSLSLKNIVNIHKLTI